MNQLKSLPEALSLSQSFQDILAFAAGQNDLFQLRRDELTTLAEGQKLVSTNRQLVNQLQNFISERVEAGKITSIEAARQSDTSIENGKLFYSQLLG